MSVAKVQAKVNRLAGRWREVIAGATHASPLLAINDFCVTRIDQIWASPHFGITSARVLKTRSSDVMKKEAMDLRGRNIPYMRKSPGCGGS